MTKRRYQRRSAWLGTLLAFAGWTAAASAGSRMTGLEIRPDAGIRIELVGAFDRLPASGYAPVRLTIANGSGRAASYRFRFRSGSMYDGVANVEYDWATTVAAAEEQRFNLCVPLSSLGGERYAYPDLQVRADGPGITSGLAHYGGYSPYTGNPRTAFAGFGRDIAVGLFGPLESLLKDRSREFRACTLEAEHFPEDWRGYLGFASIWLTEREWSAASVGSRDAMLLWVAQGGRLHLLAPAPTLPELRAWGVPMTGFPESDVGLGRVRAVRHPGEATAVDAVADQVSAPDQSALADRLQSAYQAGWPLQFRVPKAEFHMGALLVAMLVFAVVVGPLNLLMFATRSRRHRIFVTTPAISVAASLLLAGLILIQDGIGGVGGRVLLVHLQPHEHRHVVHQEQISRTGVLLTRRFEFDPEAHIAWIPLEEGNRGRSPRLQRSPAGCDGDWFASRSWQGHYVGRVVPSRARVELHNPAAVRDDRAPPVILSTFQHDLIDVYYHDPHGRYWHTPRLRVGERVTLRSTTWSEFRRSWWSPRIVSAGIRAGGRIDRLAAQPGFVYAAIDAGDGPWIETHAGIRWEDQQAVAIGPCWRPEAAGR